jgi:hypothetical protein
MMFCPTVSLSVSFIKKTATANVRRHGSQPEAMESNFFDR